MTRISTLLALAALTLSLGATQAQADTPVTVRIDSGLLIGAPGEKANVFRNIPFAAAPVGELRWAPPQRVKPWAQPRSAVEAGPSCPQPMNADGTPNSGGANGPTSEDCLQLNVFAPPHAKGAPVMVWIHGGGHRTGAGWIYGGENFARDGVVVVSINYRLGALGYFAHPALTRAAKPGEPVGNYGLMDQIAALKWVQRNIAAFGGDPKNVTVFGESAGGMSTLAILATPSARGLYAKAIVESGLGWFEPKTLADQEKAGAKALAGIGVAETATAADLRAIPVDRLTPLNADYQPFVDGRLMTETASQAIARGHVPDVPMIVGSNSGEDSLMGPMTLGEAALSRIPAAVKPAYSAEAAAGPDAFARAVFTDRVMGGPARWVAAETSGGKPTWLYYFSYVGSRFPASKTRASHADEIQYVWEYWGRRTPMSQVSAKDQEVAGLMHACWVSFAKTSAPKCGTQAWPAYAPTTDQLMEFGASSGVRAHFRKAQLDAEQASVLPTLGLGGK
ncbi:MAG TPA: carboxylesterase family protein [Phenylobacterium sp.]|jgi:para-nitrobenzyl esterase|uniref:carboxylesterase/lipase family protein n=1 Tax=Phenylobacterium sp. TaxID=1871053 RepID=UPI002D1E2DE5|nr:carboxylesterase family protein [Phenylobacterium sp.]HXA37811.1 carboxylesterase family protein [Phenylobacterium sp.]